MLDIQSLQIHYGGIAAVKGINLSIARGEQVALIGANGAGKSSTLNAIAGLLKPHAGQISYNNQDITTLAAHRRVTLGMALVPEGRGIFPRLTVAENLAMGAYCRNDTQVIAQDIQKTFAQFPRLAERRLQLAGTLSGGEQQLLAIARALLSKPQLLLLDEPSMGLAPLMIQTIFEAIKTVAQSGVTLLLVEQNARLALETCSRAYVMESGQIVLADTAQVLLDHPRVRQAYLGEMGEPT
jgi:branched-chain amino acid transport system ATP-binding protein